MVMGPERFTEPETLLMASPSSNKEPITEFSACSSCGGILSAYTCSSDQNLLAYERDTVARIHSFSGEPESA